MSNRNMDINSVPWIINIETYEGLKLNHGLADNINASALMHYAFTVGTMLQQQAFQLEGDIVAPIDYRTVMQSIATIYGTTPEQMIKFWPNIDLVLSRLKLKPLTLETIRQENKLIIL